MFQRGGDEVPEYHQMGTLPLPICKAACYSFSGKLEIILNFIINIWPKIRLISVHVVNRLLRENRKPNPNF